MSASLPLNSGHGEIEKLLVRYDLAQDFSGNSSGAHHSRDYPEADFLGTTLRDVRHRRFDAISVLTALPGRAADHSTYLVPYNVLMHAGSVVPNTPVIPVEKFPEDGAMHHTAAKRQARTAIYWQARAITFLVTPNLEKSHIPVDGVERVWREGPGLHVRRDVHPQRGERYGVLIIGLIVASAASRPISEVRRERGACLGSARRRRWQGQGRTGNRRRKRTSPRTAWRRN